MSTEQSVYDFVVPELDGTDSSLDCYRGRVLLITNTASKGSNKKQLKGLHKMQEIFKHRPFSVLAFPCNQFFYQEEKTNAKIKETYIDKNNYSFKVFSKVKVNGEDAHPLFKWLKRQRKTTKGKKIPWNFTYFLVESDGLTVHRFLSSTKWSKLAWHAENAIRLEERRIRNLQSIQYEDEEVLKQRYEELDTVYGPHDKIIPNNTGEDAWESESEDVYVGATRILEPLPSPLPPPSPYHFVRLDKPQDTVQVETIIIEERIEPISQQSPLNQQSPQAVGSSNASTSKTMNASQQPFTPPNRRTGAVMSPDDMPIMAALTTPRSELEKSTAVKLTPKEKALLSHASPHEKHHSTKTTPHQQKHVQIEDVEDEEVDIIRPGESVYDDIPVSSMVWQENVNNEEQETLKREHGSVDYEVNSSKMVHQENLNEEETPMRTALAA